MENSRHLDPVEENTVTNLKCVTYSCLVARVLVEGPQIAYMLSLL
jgi:hypothetical protein